jgi:hypothetical protein
MDPGFAAPTAPRLRVSKTAGFRPRRGYRVCRRVGLLAAANRAGVPAPVLLGPALPVARGLGFCTDCLRLYERRRRRVRRSSPPLPRGSSAPPPELLEKLFA